MANSENRNGNGDDNGFSSFFTSRNIRILAGAGFGLVSQRLWSRAGSYEADAAAINSRLSAAPEIPLSSVKNHPHTLDGRIVLIQNGVVSPIKDRLVSSSGKNAVLIKTVVYTDEPAEFEPVYKGIHKVDVSRVPFALIDHDSKSDGEFYGVMVNAGEDHLPLTHDSTVKKPLVPPVFLTRTKRVVANEDERKRNYDDIMEVRKEVEVRKVSDQSVLQAGTVLESVFGRLRTSDGGVGFPTIEPCPGFPKECFTMGKEEIKRVVNSKAKADTFTMRGYSFGVGVVSFGLLFSGIYSYS